MARPTGSKDSTKRRVSAFSKEGRQRRQAAKATKARKEQEELLRAEAIKVIREALASRDQLSATEFMLKMLNGEPIEIPTRVRRTSEDGAEPEIEVQMRYYLPTIEDMKWAAQAVAPYMHPKLNAVDVSGKKDGETHEEWLDRVQSDLKRRQEEAEENADVKPPGETLQ